MMYFK